MGMLVDRILSVSVSLSRRLGPDRLSSSAKVMDGSGRCGMDPLIWKDMGSFIS
jgi:hypothetical protein